MYSQQYDITYGDLNPTFLYSCNLRRTESEENYHCHEHIELAIILKGSGVFHIDGQDYPIKAGDLIILNPGTYHKCMLINPCSYVVENYIAFTDIHIRDLAPNIFPIHNCCIVRTMSNKIRQETFKICAAIVKEYKACQSGRYFMLKSYLVQLILILVREQQKNFQEHKGYLFESPNKKYAVKQIINFLNEHYQEKISLEQIAQNMYLSTFYISKIFKSETGDTPINYLIELRMEKARSLMEYDGAISIQNVASLVGYDDVYHFSKLFKKHFGVSPSQYRSNM
jgi:AraC-like DNA-binding protein